MQPLIQQPLPDKNTKRMKWGQLHGASLPYAIAATAVHVQCPVVVIARDIQHLHYLEEMCRFFYTNNAPEIPIRVFPDWEILPYDHFSPHQDIVSERLALLSEVSHWQRGIVLVAVNTLLTRLPPPNYINAHTFSLHKGLAINVDSMRQRLQRYGYYCVSTVMNHGEYAVRGSLFDIFPMGYHSPLRLDLFDNEIDSIRWFDPESQRTLQIVDSVRLLPAHEYPLDDDHIARFRSAWRREFDGYPMESPVYQSISNATPTAGIEFYCPLFFEKMATLFDYLPADTLFLSEADLQAQSNHYWHEIENRYHQCQGDIQRPLLEPAKLFITTEDLSAQMNRFVHISMHKEPLTANTGRFNWPSYPLPNLVESPGHKLNLAPLVNFLSQQSDARVLFCAETAGRLERLLTLLKSIEFKPTLVKTWHEFTQQSTGHCVIIAPFEEGLWFKNTLADVPTIVIAEANLLGQHVVQRRRRKPTDIDSELLIRNLSELTVGAPVTHIDHGVGRYIGLETLDLNDMAQEFVVLAYAGDDKLYVPVTSLHLISRYSGADVENAPLHRLGSEQWERAKRKAAQKAHDVAAELLAVEAQRQMRRTMAYSLPQEYSNFVSAFPFEETPDQEQAIAAVLADLQQDQATDRLICGDVGFGKTEVAMRAAFIVAHHSRQVAILVPTTLLAQQHYESFKERFANWPVEIAMLSRFNTPKEQTQTILKLANGEIDIVIGTHKLLQPTIHFKNLGLIIIDEEHRFGVRHKERLKQLRAEVDILTLTATPIPRTLNMAMTGMRAISLIATPPARRLSIKTFVHQSSKSIVREALLREILRGGQVYYLHNKVATIQRVADELADWVPEARIRIAHGQMPERELEQVMKDFYHQQFNVLVCSTIIETGIDVPTANTIVIQRADHFGLAQLHQLRGRVGRSHHQAYAYLLTADPKALSNDAKKRLDAISSMEDLGAGFSLASHDLEIRGAGELLGDEQSGHMQEIGFSLYMEMLNRTIDAIKTGKNPELSWEPKHGCEIDLKITALIPDDYLPDVHTRLVLYKRIASLPDTTCLDEMEIELVDRFGSLPKPTKNLMKLTQLRLRAEALGIKKVLLHAKGGTLEFDATASLDPNKLISLIQSDPQRYQMQGAHTLKLRYVQADAEERFAVLEKLFSALV